MQNFGAGVVESSDSWLGVHDFVGNNYFVADIEESCFGSGMYCCRTIAAVVLHEHDCHWPWLPGFADCIVQHDCCELLAAAASHSCVAEFVVRGEAANAGMGGG